MAHYVDGFIIPIKKKNLKAYKKLAILGRKVWMEHGAISYYECVADEIKKTWGFPFQKLCKLKPDETLIFAFVVYKNKSEKKKIIAKVHNDPRMTMSGLTMPFDEKRFSTGGFKAIVAS